MFKLFRRQSKRQQTQQILLEMIKIGLSAKFLLTPSLVFTINQGDPPDKREELMEHMCEKHATSQANI